MPQCRADPVGRGTVEAGRGVRATPPLQPVVRRGTGGGWGGNDGGPLTGGDGLPLSTAKLGLWVFMGVVTVLFSIIASTYVTRMGFADWRPLPEPRLLWLNTGVLILSSVAMQWAQVAARRGRIDSLRVGLLAGGVSAWAFLAGQLWAWQQLGASGYVLAGNPANTFFYLITALHGLHLCGGLVAWAKTTVKVWRGFEVRLSVELCAIYWLFCSWLAGLFV